MYAVQAVALAPLGSSSPLRRGMTRSHSTPIQMAVVPPGIAAVVSAPIMYSLMSINEYMTHRWYQHAEISKVGWWRALRMPKVRGGGHVEHHAETLDDMSLKTDEKWRNTAAAKTLDNDVYRGTAFTWMTSFIMTIQMCISVIPIYTKILGVYASVHIRYASARDAPACAGVERLAPQHARSPRHASCRGRPRLVDGGPEELSLL